MQPLCYIEDTCKLLGCDDLPTLVHSDALLILDSAEIELRVVRDAIPAGSSSSREVSLQSCFGAEVSLETDLSESLRKCCSDSMDRT
jgi:hypothetical protein